MFDTTLQFIRIHLATIHRALRRYVSRISALVMDDFVSPLFWEPAILAIDGTLSSERDLYRDSKRKG